MDADKTLLRLVDEEIARLQVARSEIASRLGAGHSNGNSKQTTGRVIERISRKGKTREEQVIQFLTANGPAASKDILSGTGMPRGSLGFTLTRAAAKVERLEDGKWALKK